MKQFLRFQISGMVFLLWIVIFSSNTSSLFNSLSLQIDTAKMEKIDTSVKTEKEETKRNEKTIITKESSMIATTKEEQAPSKRLKESLGLILSIILVAGLPIGVLIHQLSVLLKNWGFGKCWNCLSDELNEETKGVILALDNCKESKTYILERISNLNSFYYVRFDNGILAPFLAFITVATVTKVGSINWSFVALAAFIGIITVLYIPRICTEIKDYRVLLKKLENKACNSTLKGD